FSPRQATVQVGGGRDEDAAAALAITGVVGRQHEESVGGHADRLLGVVSTIARGCHAPEVTGRLRAASCPAARFARVGETSEPLVIQARADIAPTERWTRRVAKTALAYFHLTKPRVIELLLVTTLPAMILAAGEMPSLGLIVSVLVGGALAAGGAN